MRRPRPLGVLLVLTVVSLALHPAIAAAVQSHGKPRIDAPRRSTALLASPSVIVPGAVSVAAESEPNDNPTQANPWVGNRVGFVNAEDDWDDVYSVWLSAGDELEVRLQWAEDEYADLDLYLYAPGTDEYFEPSDVDRSVQEDINIESIRYKSTLNGYFYVDVNAFDTAGDVEYSLVTSPDHLYDFGSVKRVYGDNRYDTAVEISKATFPELGCSTVVLATGANFPDALTASGLAGVYRGPVLLTPPGTVPESVIEEFERLGTTDVIIVGGESAVSSAAATALVSLGYNVRRISGATRFETAVLVAEEVVAASGSTEVFIARSDTYPDALALAPFAYAKGIPILLTGATYLKAETRSFIESNGIDTVRIAGGIYAISIPVEVRIRSLNGGTMDTERCGGASRYSTAAVISRFLSDEFDYNSYWDAGVATGRSFPDALAGGAAMGYGGGVLLLTPPETIDPSTYDFIQSEMQPWQDFVVFGGESAIQTTGALIDIWHSIRTEPLPYY